MMGGTTYIPKNILQRARENGYAVFLDKDIAYKILEEKEKLSFKVIAEIEGKIIGITQNAEGGEHDVLKVEPEYRGMGIGEMLFALKTSLDGKRKHEWSQKYSRILFLMRHGYYPIATIDTAGGTMKPLEKEEKRRLCEKIKEAKNASFTDDEADNLYYFQLAPWKASFLARGL